MQGELAHPSVHHTPLLSPHTIATHERCSARVHRNCGES